MNILLLCDEYPPGVHGGIGTVVRLQAVELVKQGHTVIVTGFYDWGYGEADYFVDEGVEVHRFRRRLSSHLLAKQTSMPVRATYRILKDSRLFQQDIKLSLRGYKQHVEELIKKHKIDVIEMPEYNDYIRFCKSYVPFPEFSAPTIVKLHGSLTYYGYMDGNIVPEYWQKMEHDIMAQADAVCSVSKYRAEKAIELKEYAGPIKVLYNGIRIGDIGNYEKKHPKRVVFTGSLFEKKGIFQLMKAWNIVHKTMPDAQLVIFGKGHIDKVKATLDEEVGKTVSFMGHVSRAELFPYLGESRAAIFPSFAESFALGPMEAMACQTAVIYTSRTSGPELIQDGENGLLVDPKDVEDMAQKLLLLLNDNALADRLAKNAKQTILDKFQIKVIAQEHIQYYQQVVDSVEQKAN